MELACTTQPQYGPVNAWPYLHLLHAASSRGRTQFSQPQHSQQEASQCVGLAGMHMMGGALPGLPVLSLAVHGDQRPHNTGRSAGGRAPKPHRYRKGAGGGGQGQVGSSFEKML